MTRPLTTITGPMPANLANAISEVLHRIVMAGMPLDEACCVAVGVIADYARDQYGDTYLDGLAEIVRSRAGQPMPRRIT
jgi:hypothetical protein